MLSKILLPLSTRPINSRMILHWALGLLLVWLSVKVNVEAWNVLVRTMISETHGGMANRVFIFPLFLILIIACVILMNSIGKKYLKAQWIFFGLIATLALALRLAWIIQIPTEPQSDFAVYQDMAIQLATNQSITMLKPLGYPVILSIAYRLFPYEGSGRILNVCLGMITVLLVYWAARSVSDSNGGLFAMLLMALSPSEIFMSSVLGSEVANSVFIIGAIAVMLSLEKKGKGINNNFFLLPGILLGVSVAIRPTSALILGAMIAYLLVAKSNLSDRLMNSGRMAAGLFIIPLIMVLWTSISSQQFSMRCLFYDSYPLLSGTNIKYKGFYNIEDAKLYVSIPEETRSAKVFEIAQKRIKAVDFPVLSTFFSNKILYYLSDNLYGSFWPFYTVKLGISFNQQFSFQRWIDVIAQTWYFLSLIGTSIIIVWFLVEKNPLWLLLSGTVLFSALPHTVFEVQSRYHHMLLPVFSLACGVLFWRFLTKNKSNDNHL